MFAKDAFRSLLVMASLGLSVGLASYVARAATPARCFVAKAGVVYDGRTGLAWQQAVDANLHTWDDSKVYCQNLTLDGGGWRLPARKELSTILDYGRVNPAIDPVAFPNTPSELFVSATPVVLDQNGTPIDTRWYVDFNLGDGQNADKRTAARVRCVR